jgi:glutamate---cysteine ligase / carboxylate-amine ligase
MNLYSGLHGKSFEIPTLGVEEEYQIVDARTRELSSDTKALLAEGEALYGTHIRPEFHSPVVEVVTTVCQHVKEITEQLVELRRTMIGLARKQHLAIVSASTHPITHWREVKLSPGERYLQIERDLGDVVRSNLIYGMHCHLGIKDPDARIHVMNSARNFIPHLVALSCSSPFWQGRDTGLASTRTAVFRRFPRTGLPEDFNSFLEFEQYVKLLIEVKSIDNAKRIYWDIRPHPFFPTIEFRACDLPTRVRECTGIVALIHCLGTRLLNLYRQDLGYRLHPRALVAENCYRAYRYGLSGEFIDFTTRRTLPVKESIRRLIDSLSDEIRLLGVEQEIGEVIRILDHGNSADRQRRVFAETGSLHAVVDYLIAETAEGVV